jgi:hypothetical protein
MRRVEIIRCSKGLSWSFNAAQASGLLNSKITMDAKLENLEKLFHSGDPAKRAAAAHASRNVCH